MKGRGKRQIPQKTAGQRHRPVTSARQLTHVPVSPSELLVLVHMEWRCLGAIAVMRADEGEAKVSQMSTDELEQLLPPPPPFSHAEDIMKKFEEDIMHEGRVLPRKGVRKGVHKPHSRLLPNGGINIACLPPTKANRAQSPAGSPDLHMWESCRMMPLVGGSSRGYPASPAPSFRRRSKLTLDTLISSQDLAIRSRIEFRTTMVVRPGIREITTPSELVLAAGFLRHQSRFRLFCNLSAMNVYTRGGRGKREIPEKTRRPVASSETISTCENPECTGRGLNPVRLGRRRAV
ncbi:hypothetical protein PR048_031514 [Dryococelus australis]|uniref:Uncharacterized protein n=1 Tax=Dryococelus australis TaxID=614101 RepID=A0ABQ9G5H5_9NEOP|nr:hypothetical protein PR048_031514 [Dryococelus australis]